MNRKHIPNALHQLCSDGCLELTDIRSTQDGFFLAYKSLSDILAVKQILDFPDSEGARLACDRFFDDWFLYAVPNEADYTYSLLKLREQEHDAADGAPADGDTPGVTISFIAFDCQKLLACLADPADENRKALNREVNRVVAHRGQRHHKALKQYFANPQSEAPYLVADLYIKHIAALAENGYLETPEQYRKATSPRLPRFIASLNEEANYVVCDSQKIYIRDPKNPSPYECAAILATHTGNTSVYSFAAEVEYHARFLLPILRLKVPFIGKSVYDSAIRADMTVGDTEFQGPAPFYRSDSKIVKRQHTLHQVNR